MFNAYRLKFSTGGPTSEMVNSVPRYEPGKGDPWNVLGTPKRVPKWVPRPPGIAKQVIDCEKLSTSDVAIGRCV